MIKGILSGDRYSLSKALTLVESNRPEHQSHADQILSACSAISSQSRRIAISGSPGVGKSTIIEVLGNNVINKGENLAVLAIDPSSNLSKGSILGDKTRMESLSKNENAFIRPSPTSGTLGGIAKKTFESILLCEAAGFNNVIIETVGVGQSETLVHNMTDVMVLLVAPGAGDELQGIKRGIVELADIIVINKSEEEMKKLSDSTKKDYKNASHLFPAKKSNWTTSVIQTSAINNSGITALMNELDKYFDHVKANKYFFENRKSQLKYILEYNLGDRMKNFLLNNQKVRNYYHEILKELESGKLGPSAASNKFFDGIDIVLKDEG